MGKIVKDVPALVITPEKAPVITGNYDVIKRFLTEWKTRVSKMDLSEDNLEEVQAIKKAAVSFRNRFKDAVDDTKRRLFNDPKAFFDAQVKGLNSLLAEVEGAADEVLNRLEQQRLDEINEVLDHYKIELQKKYGDFGRLIIYPREFYNKTVPKGYSSMDKFWKENLEAQFKVLKEGKDIYDGNVRLIEKACKDNPLLNVQHWIDLLRIGHDIASILERIDEEKIRLNTVVPEQPVVPEQTTERTIQETVKNYDFTTDFPGRMNTMSICITYPCDLAGQLTELFNELKKHGIKIKTIKEAAAC